MSQAGKNQMLKYSPSSVILVAITSTSCLANTALEKSLHESTFIILSMLRQTLYHRNNKLDYDLDGKKDFFFPAYLKESHGKENCNLCDIVSHWIILFYDYYVLSFYKDSAVCVML